MDTLIEIFQNAQLVPIAIEKWKNICGAPLEMKRQENKRLRTIQILKIGKLLEIKYKKMSRLSSPFNKRQSTY